MRLLIDGYNLLYATDLFGAGDLAGTLRGSREALIAFLAERLAPKERTATVIVFDAADAPPGLPDRYTHEGIDVRFARGYPDADAMIEAILEGVHRARGLTVVSGDRRVQRAARSSGADWIDSNAWFAELCRRRREDTDDDDRVTPSGPQPDWATEFADPVALARIEQEAAAAPPPRPPAPSSPATPTTADSDPTPAPRRKRTKRRPPLSDSGEKPSSDFGAGLFDPFPPGYADDLLDPDADRCDRDDPNDRGGV